jgi:hypothetical protein
VGRAGISGKFEAADVWDRGRFPKLPEKQIHQPARGNEEFSPHRLCRRCAQAMRPAVLAASADRERAVLEEGWTVLKTWLTGSISDSIGLDGFGVKTCGDSQGFSIPIRPWRRRGGRSNQ